MTAGGNFTAELGIGPTQWTPALPVVCASSGQRALPFSPSRGSKAVPVCLLSRSSSGSNPFRMCRGYRPSLAGHSRTASILIAPIAGMGLDWIWIWQHIAPMPAAQAAPGPEWAWVNTCWCSPCSGLRPDPGPWQLCRARHNKSSSRVHTRSTATHALGPKHMMLA